MWSALSSLFPFLPFFPPVFFHPASLLPPTPTVLHYVRGKGRHKYVEAVNKEIVRKYVVFLSSGTGDREANFFFLRPLALNRHLRSLFLVFLLPSVSFHYFPLLVSSFQPRTFSCGSLLYCLCLNVPLVSVQLQSFVFPLFSVPIPLFRWLLLLVYLVLAFVF